MNDRCRLPSSEEGSGCALLRIYSKTGYLGSLEKQILMSFTTKKRELYLNSATDVNYSWHPLFRRLPTDAPQCW